MKQSCILPAILASFLWVTMQAPVNAQTNLGSQSAHPRITQQIDNSQTVTLQGNVRSDLTPNRDLGPVDDGLPVRLYLILQRSPEQQADLNNLLARQQQPTAAEYHRWLTPQEFGERFGASTQDITKITAWLQSQGFQVNDVLNNATMIDFAGTAGGIRNTFHTQLHNWNVSGGTYAANALDPVIPAALAEVVAGIKGLSKIPKPAKHTPIQSFSHDPQTNRWHNLGTDTTSGSNPQFTDSTDGNYLVTPRDFYTIYDAIKVYGTGNLGASATIGLPEPTDMHYGTVNSTTGQATGGDVVTFRTTFGIAGTLNMKVMHGAGTVTCGDPGITGAEGEANLDAEWANAVAPSAQLIFMSCDDSNSIGDGFTTALAALIDNNLSDVISSSYGSSEIFLTSADFTLDDQLASQAAAQGQSFIDAAGDAGSADADQNTASTATHGFNVDQYAGQPLVTAVGGTDFSDHYDADQGGPPQSTYWSRTNTQFFNDALSYIPETPWNGSCADSIIAKDSGNTTPAAYCAVQGSAVNGTLQGGGGGFSAHYAQPSYQTGTPGLSGSATNRATPDISFFAAAGYWGHYLVVCDSSDASTACSSTNTTFGGAGGTSFTAPQFAGIAALLVTVTGERQGTLNPGIYALAKAQFTAPATATACYSNGQTNNIGVTIGLPATTCTFHDVTTGNNDEPCQAGSLDCYVNPGATYGLLSTTGASSLTIGYPAAPEYDLATGLGSLDIYNFITNWKQAYSSTTSLAATPTSVTSSQSTTLKATVTTGTPTGFTGPAPALTGSVNFASGSTSLGSCTLSGGTCSVSVSGSALQAGANSVTATFVGSGTYPSSTSSIVTVTVTSSASSQTITFGPLANRTYGAAPFALTATASSGLPVSYSVTGPATVSGSTLTITGAGMVTVTAMQAGNSSYSPATPVSQSFTVSKAVLTVTANSFSRAFGAANPTLTYAITGFVNGDSSSVVSGSATLTTTAASTSPAGSYPINFATEGLTASNYTFAYVNGTLTVTSAASGGSLAGASTSATTAVNLTAEGTADWIHWGPAALARKNGVTAQISTYSVDGGGTAVSYNNDPRTLSWSDGTPTTSGADNDGVYTNNVPTGFSFTAPADTTSRTLRVYVGGFNSGGTLTAHLSDQSAADFVNVTSAVTGAFDRNYTLTYAAASAGQTLTITWVNSSGEGNVTLNGAALSVTTVGGSLAGSGTNATTEVDLTEEGTADWIHWGPAALTRKIGVTAQISTYSVSGGGTAVSYNNDPRTLSWSDGTPTAAGADNHGLYTNNVPTGFSFTAPADTTTRTLTVYVGGYNSGGTLTAHLSDQSAADFVDITSAVTGAFDRNYTLTYKAASAGQTLTITWVNSSGAGNVTLNGAALSVTAAGGSLAGSGTSATTTVNLTAEGTTDWIHWGSAAQRKSGVTAQISTYTVAGDGIVVSYNNDPRTLSWSDGTPTASGSDNDGLYTNNVPTGFWFTAPADTTSRTLRVYVGGFNSGGTLTAHLSDQSAADFVDFTSAVTGAFDRNYTLTYKAASAGQTLTINWVNSSGEGNVTLNGAALQ